MLATAVGVIAVPLQAVTGDLSTRFVAKSQPEKFAAMEAHFEAEQGAPLRIGAVILVPSLLFLYVTFSGRTEPERSG